MTRALRSRLARRSAGPRNCAWRVQPGHHASVNAAIFLKLQTTLGAFSQLLSAQSDDQTGGFVLVPCGAVFNGNRITVLSFGETAFSEVTGLNELTAQPELAVRGLLFYEVQPVTASGITINGMVAAPVALLRTNGSINSAATDTGDTARPVRRRQACGARGDSNLS